MGTKEKILQKTKKDILTEQNTFVRQIVEDISDKTNLRVQEISLTEETKEAKKEKPVASAVETGAEKPLKQEVDNRLEHSFQHQIQPDRSFFLKEERSKESANFVSREKQVSESPFISNKYSFWIKCIYSAAVNLKLRLKDKEHIGILFTSSVHGEGTSTLCAQIAFSLAKVCPGKILLLDCNSVHPNIHNFYKIKSEPGLTDILIKDLDWRKVIRNTTLKNYFVMTYGTQVKEPLSLIGSDKMKSLLDKLKAEFSYVILDTPPVLGSGEVELLLPWVEGVVLVIKAHQTRREVVTRALDRLSMGNAELLGAILNQQEFVIPQFIYQRLK